MCASHLWTALDEDIITTVTIEVKDGSSTKELIALPNAKRNRTLLKYKRNQESCWLRNKQWYFVTCLRNSLPLVNMPMMTTSS
ncbi:hypothetical protein NPIL_349921 [Nephila pilipes]|uniref:Uncharacterized protein n=1 Tax=Nephila pilipes TaxID=299642 RepID=A0A8X6TL00_NEPPI|nr:hypothetical protein NPIL_349921 [Nephila pilipes]